MNEQPKIFNFGKIVFPTVKRIKYNDFVSMYLLPNNTQDICRIQVILNGGIAHERINQLARITSLMTNQGSVALDCKAIAEKLDFCGTRFTRTTLPSKSIFDLITLTRLTDDTIPVLEQILKFPIFPEENLNVIKTNLTQALKSQLKRTDAVAELEFKHLFYGNSHYNGRRTDFDKISGITPDDTLNFYNSFLRAGKVKIVLSGNITDNLIAEIGKIFGNDWIKQSKVPARKRSVINSDGIDRTHIFDMPKAIQSSIVMGTPTIGRRDNDFIPLRIVSYILGGYFGSRFMQNIREDKGYTYGIYSLLTSDKKCGCFKIKTDCDVKYTYKVISEVKKEIERIKGEPVGNDELSMAKSCLLSDIARLIDTPFDIADYIATKSSIKSAKDFFNTQIERIQNITAGEIIDTANKYLDTNRFITTIATNENKLKKIPFEH